VENAYFTGLGPTKRIVLYDTLAWRGSEPGRAMRAAQRPGPKRRGHRSEGQDEQTAEAHGQAGSE